MLLGPQFNGTSIFTESFRAIFLHILFLCQFIGCPPRSRSAYGTAVEVLCLILVLFIHTVLVKGQSTAEIVIELSFLLFSFLVSCFTFHV